MKRVFAISYVFIAITCTAIPARIINIPADYSTIQAGIDASANSDTVLVMPGRYHEHINNEGHNIMLASLYLIDADTMHIVETTIDGDFSASAVAIRNCGDSSSALIGFTILHGQGIYGGGISLYNSNILIKNNFITECQADIYGGGIYCDGSNPKIVHNVISRCYSYY